MTTTGDDTWLGGALRALAAYRPGSDAGMLDEAVADTDGALSDPDFALWDGPTKAYVWMLAASAAILRSRTPRARPEDLDRAVALFEQAMREADVTTPDPYRCACNLAAALADRFERDRNRADLDRARSLLPPAIASLRGLEQRIDVALHLWGNCGYASWGDTKAVHDLDEAIAAYREALSCTEPADHERAGYLNSLGLALAAAGRVRGEQRQLHDAATAYDEARSLVDSTVPAWLDATVNLASLNFDRFQSEGDEEFLIRALSFYREAFRVATISGARVLATIADNLGVSMLSRFHTTGDLLLLREAAGLFQQAASLHRAGSQGWSAAVSALSQTLVIGYDFTGRLHLLDAAIGRYEMLIGQDSGRTIERCQALGVCLLKRYRRTDAWPDLTRGLELLALAAQEASRNFVRSAARNSEANGWHVRFEVTGNLDDLDRAISLTREAIALAPADSREHTIALSNLGVHLLSRYETRGEAVDLQEAIRVQRLAVTLRTSEGSDQANALAALADSLAAFVTAHPSEPNRRSASEAFRAAIAAARKSLPEQVLGVASRWGRWAASLSRWEEAAEAYTLAVEAIRGLVSTQNQRIYQEMWLRAAGGVPAAAAYALVKANRPAQAAVALDAGRALLLSEALRR